MDIQLEQRALVMDLKTWQAKVVYNGGLHPLEEVEARKQLADYDSAPQKFYHPELNTLRWWLNRKSLERLYHCLR